MGSKVLNLLRHFAFIAVVYAMVIQPAMQTFAFFSRADHVWAYLDLEEDTNGEERQENDGKDEKIDFQNVSVYEYHLTHYERLSYYDQQRPICDFGLEIPIPPPEQV